MAQNFTKAYSLEKIKKIYKNSVPLFLFFQKEVILKKRNTCIQKIKTTFKDDIILRSSALNEDTTQGSKAGFYDSYVIKKNNFNTLEEKINKIIKKFKNKKDQIIVQRYIKNPEFAGVIFTKDKTTNSPYFDINYDSSKKTDLITSGKNNPTMKSLLILKSAKKVPAKFKKLIQISKNLEKIFNNDRLDIEFCIKNKDIFILQCRPLLGTKKIIDKKILDSIIVNLENKFENINQKNETLFGKKTILSNMSDWNPAEMIGKKPSQLALSLYSELITNSVWAEQRYKYGYKNVIPNKLMLNFAGTPYIDLRVDLNSFLPFDLDKNISEKLINFFLAKIKKNPEIHDKIEFELINTCFDFTLSKKNELPLSKNEKKKYFNSLKKLTNNILNPKKNILKNEIKKIQILNSKIAIIKKSKLSPIQKIHYLVSDCKKYGTLPFAGIARCAFIGKTILDSLKNIKLLTNEDIENFYLGINTVSKEINLDYYRSKKNNSYVQFLEKYGHVRPSTYSILTKNYRENYKTYFSDNGYYPKYNISKKLKLDKRKIKIIDNIFKKNKLKLDFMKFLNFTKLAIENREYSKLIFTKSIDEIFINLKTLSKKIKVDEKNLEHLDIDIILKSFHNVEQEKLKKIILRNININQKAYKFSQAIILPDVIDDSKNFTSFYNVNNKENYITNKNTFGEILELKKLRNFKAVSNKIVLIENADPGYDFLFSYKLKGLVTKYGGSNSHMAIRCMELGLPAIIGTGEKVYDRLSKSKKVFIDCNNKNFSIIQ